jgi:chromate transporter
VSGTGPAHQPEHAPVAATWPQLIGMFLRLGVVAFGGPVAHIALMDREVVERRRWVDRQHFLDLMAATNLLPGPNSTQMTMHVGYVQKGDRGLWAAGLAFIVPAAAITLALSWAWVEYRTLPAVDAAFRGLQPTVLAIVVTAMLGLAPRAADTTVTRALLVAATGLALLGVGELLVLALGAGVGAVLLERDGRTPPRRWLRRAPRPRPRPRPGPRGGGAVAAVAALLTAPALLGAAAAGPVAPAGMIARLWWEFLRFGVTLFGSGYLLLAYLQSRLVEDLGLLSTARLLEAIVIGEMTPGPLFTTSTAVGYLLGGVAGAVVATTAIFLPSFPLAMLLGRVLPRVTRSARARAVIRGLGAVVVGVMLAFSIRIGLRVIVDVPSAALLTAGVVALRSTRLPPLALVPLGALAGVGLEALGV